MYKIVDTSAFLSNKKRTTQQKTAPEVPVLRLAV